MSSASCPALEAIINMPEEEVILYAKRIVAEGRAIEVLNSMHMFNHQVCYKKTRMVALVLFEALVKNYIQTQDAHLAAFFKTLKWRSKHLQNRVYQECAERVRSLDALMTSTLIFSITPEGASNVVQRNELAEKKALIFKTYAQNELEGLQIRYAHICAVLQEVCVWHVNGIFRIISDYEDEHFPRMLVYAIHEKYKIYKNVYPHLYNITLGCFARFYINNESHRDFRRAIELGMRIVDPVMRESVCAEILRAAGSWDALQRRALYGHYYAAAQVVFKNNTEGSAIEVGHQFPALKLIKEIECMLEIQHFVYNAY